MHRIFVYGTLKRGGTNHQLLREQRLLGPACTVAQYRLYGLAGYPGMVHDPQGGRAIAGELWEVDSACLEKLDELEGTGSGLYARKAVQLLPPHERAGAETYLYLQSVAGRPDLGGSFS